jgi:hypothetical protein
MVQEMGIPFIDLFGLDTTCHAVGRSGAMAISWTDSMKGAQLVLVAAVTTLPRHCLGRVI